jgi:hypothetical protein
MAWLPYREVSVDVYWIGVGIAGASLITSTTILYVVYVVLKVLRSTNRAERAGDERLQILREQQQRLGFLREEERRACWRRSCSGGAR